jgi:hypothetical protein
MSKIHNKEGPDHDVWCHIFRLSRDEITKLANDRNEIRPRDGTERMPRDGTQRMPRDGTGRMPRDGTQRMPRDGTERMPRDGTGRMPRDGTQRMPRDGTGRMPKDGTEGIKRVARDEKGRLARDGIRRLARDGIRERQINVSNQNRESTWVQLKYPIIKPPGKGFFNRAKYFRRRNEIGGKPPLGCGEAELCPGVNEGKSDKFSKFLTLKIENRIVLITI